MKKIVIVLSFLLFTGTAHSVEKIQLMKPDFNRGKLLMEALEGRQSNRAFKTDPLSDELLSNLLWAAFGVNREGKDLRTAPSAMNWKEIDIYVAMSQGVYLYDATNHQLLPYMDGDIREFTGIQDFTQTAPVNLIFVADYNRMTIEEEMKAEYSAADTAYISQNVYLFCSSEGLATVVVGWVNKEELVKKMNLKEHQKIIFTQPVGYPSN